MQNITEGPDYDVRYSKESDLPYLRKWISAPNDKRWYPISKEKDLEIMTKNWIGFSRFGASLTAEYRGKPVAVGTLFLMPYRKLIHHALLYFIVDPENRRKGIGTSIVKNTTHLGKVYFRFERIHCEIYEGCPAYSLLKKLGYQQIIRQDRFVKERRGNYLARMIMEIEL
jgi:RimJ/RimL family protein N-acetyltransferase